MCIVAVVFRSEGSHWPLIAMLCGLVLSLLVPCSIVSIYIYHQTPQSFSSIHHHEHVAQWSRRPHHKVELFSAGEFSGICLLASSRYNVLLAGFGMWGRPAFESQRVQYLFRCLFFFWTVCGLMGWALTLEDRVWLAWCGNWDSASPAPRGPYYLLLNRKRPRNFKGFWRRSVTWRQHASWIILNMGSELVRTEVDSYPFLFAFARGFQRCVRVNCLRLVSYFCV
jgi:hypothetical protein